MYCYICIIVQSGFLPYGDGQSQEDQEKRTKFSSGQCTQRTPNPCAPEFIPRRSPESKVKQKKAFPSRIFTPSLRPTKEGRPQHRKAGMPPKYYDCILEQPKNGLRIICRHPEKKVKVPPRSTFTIPRSASEGQVPTKPLPPYATVKRLRETVSAPAPPPRVAETSSQTKSRRRTKITPSLLLRKIRSAPTKSAVQLADDIAMEYSLTPPEKTDVYNQVLMARTLRQDFAAQIRRHHPLASLKESRWEFLHWLEETCQAFERMDKPDEFE